MRLFGWQRDRIKTQGVGSQTGRVGLEVHSAGLGLASHSPLPTPSTPNPVSCSHKLLTHHPEQQNCIRAVRLFFPPASLIKSFRHTQLLPCRAARYESGVGQDQLAPPSCHRPSTTLTLTSHICLVWPSYLSSSSPPSPPPLGGGIAAACLLIKMSVLVAMSFGCDFCFAGC